MSQRASSAKRASLGPPTQFSCSPRDPAFAGAEVGERGEQENAVDREGSTNRNGSPWSHFRGALQVETYVPGNVDTIPYIPQNEFAIAPAFRGADSLGGIRALARHRLVTTLASCLHFVSGHWRRSLRDELPGEVALLFPGVR
jgi:hypothetical protein